MVGARGMGESILIGSDPLDETTSGRFTKDQWATSESARVHSDNTHQGSNPPRRLVVEKLKAVPLQVQQPANQ